MIHRRSLTEPCEREQPRTLRRKNSRAKHFKAAAVEQQRIHDQVINLTMRAISTNTVACLTPFVTSKRATIQQDLYTQPASQQTRAIYFSSYTSSQLPSKGSAKKKSVLDRLLQIINCDAVRQVKRRKIKQLVKTDEDVFSQKYLSESKEIYDSQKKFKRHIQDKMNKTARAHRSVFQLTSPSYYDIIEDKTDPSSMVTQTTFPRKKRTTRNSHFYSRTKKRILTEVFVDDEDYRIPKKLDAGTVTFIEYQGKMSAKNKFLNEHRRIKQYCPNLIKNEEVILSIEKEGTKKHQFLKKCLDQALGRVG